MERRQVAQLRSLRVTWQNSSGGKLIFTEFSWRDGPLPPSYGQGTREEGSGSITYPSTTQQRPAPGMITIRFGSGNVGSFPAVSLEIEGPASAPSFLCTYPDPTGTCTFKKSTGQ